MLKLSERFLEMVKLHASKSYPEECCGFLVGTAAGREKEVLELLEIENWSEENRNRRFMIRPDDYRDAESFAKKKGLDLLGLYHSHPDHPARPSQFDLEHALPWWSYLIISVEHGNPSNMASWLLDEDRSRFEEESVLVEAKGNGIME